MKKNILSIFSLCALMGLSGCNAFLELEPLDKVSPDQLLETEGGVKALLYNPQNHPDEFLKRNGSVFSEGLKRSGSILSKNE